MMPLIPIERKLEKLGIEWKNGNADMTRFHKIRINQSGAISAGQWCQDSFGDEWIWSSPIQTDYSDFYFANEQDALAFKLKFGSTTA